MATSVNVSDVQNRNGSFNVIDNFDDFFAFKSWGPEIVNGRLAMLGFVSGAAAEITSGETTLSQFSAHHWAFVLAAVLFTAASFMPRFQGETTAKPESKENGMWKASTELLNGRAAMVGLSAMFVQEAITGNPVF